MAVVVIPQFEQLAVASTLNYGGPTAGIIVVEEDVDTAVGDPLAREARRVVGLLLGDTAETEEGRG